MAFNLGFNWFDLLYQFVSYRIIEYRCISIFTVDDLNFPNIKSSNQINNKKKQTKGKQNHTKSKYHFPNKVGMRLKADITILKATKRYTVYFPIQNLLKM